MLICKATGRSYFWKKCIFRLIFTSCDANIAFKDLSPPNAFHQVRLFYLKCIFRTIKIGPVAQLVDVYATDYPSWRHQNLFFQNYLLLLSLEQILTNSMQVVREKKTKYLKNARVLKFLYILLIYNLLKQFVLMFFEYCIPQKHDENKNKPTTANIIVCNLYFGTSKMFTF